MLTERLDTGEEQYVFPFLWEKADRAMLDKYGPCQTCGCSVLRHEDFHCSLRTSSMLRRLAYAYEWVAIGGKCKDHADCLEWRGGSEQ